MALCLSGLFSPGRGLFFESHHNHHIPLFPFTSRRLQ
ncbi:hypothetical protein STM14_3897 [Salmonella enterica subsp. enterica serovar Typhimurium str. 14028S]|uniref:Uncharacterized protein n=2 Tax=Salmonella enterica I TaxID=59201 RepID=A0A0F6B702_SALT1|nr:hypothetical protein SPAB_04017 [Salmonella enterica subsp. enterica serovar Paratyphi B str. SPB7]ACY90299.1 hypothetical protein STM14_3897 [Salmonella enterica subsp. enterica serovar Typhimurium str. 14028S]